MKFKSNIIFFLLLFSVLSILSIQATQCPSETIDICHNKNLRCCAKATTNDYECCTPQEYREYFDQFPKLSESEAEASSSDSESKADVSLMVQDLLVTVVGVIVVIITWIVCFVCWCCPFGIFHKKYIKGIVLRRNDQGQAEQGLQRQPLHQTPQRSLPAPQGSPHLQPPASGGLQPQAYPQRVKPVQGYSPQHMYQPHAQQPYAPPVVQGYPLEHRGYPENHPPYPGPGPPLNMDAVAAPPMSSKAEYERPYHQNP